VPVSLSFLTTLRPKHPDFLATMTPEVKAVMGQHMAYTRQLFDQGKNILGGAATDGAIGIIGAIAWGGFGRRDAANL